ncbi:MAG: membrane dipeptidase [Bacteroidota bacterium]|nr:membrane dipeptidase [Bacteroidota bacterium]MDP4215903.1 membrane dipeptidase [Bacteroidota bacterium]MDP4247149.1 membrane dipeptidase [Bacteroidota bacterium]MDP4254792.1 membrane dipeptidase [Bacteroidota bacterium]MDP4259517.1 membrane dipeptidase [Bacteroidota bacterium]
MFIVDAHLDLAMNAMEWNRDLTRPVADIRKRETGMNDKPDRARGTVALPELRRGRVGLVVATQIARFVAPGNPLPGWHSPEQAWAQTQAQRSWYQAMEAKGEMQMIADAATLDAHCARWMAAHADPSSDPSSDSSPVTLPVGYILSLEGADSLITPDYVERAWQYGLRAIGPAHYGPGRYANGTDATGGLTADGRRLLKEMERLKIILDATHLCDDAFWDAIDLYDGPVWASHNNCRALVDHNRQFSDEMIKALIERGAVIGGALDSWMMVPGWVQGRSTPEATGCDLNKLIDHLDHICQLAGNTLHVGIGTDLDGAFGKEQCPHDLETIADLQKFPDLLNRRGYKTSDIENIMHGNWLRFLRKAWGA